MTRRRGTPGESRVAWDRSPEGGDVPETRLFESASAHLAELPSAAMSPSQAIILFLAGVGAGFINTVAGGGSAISLPVLTELVGASVANGTNRVAILIANIVAAAGFERDRMVPWKIVKPLVPPAIVGAAGGAYVATRLSAGAMRNVFAVVLVLIALSVLLRPNRWLEEQTPRLRQPWTSIVFLAIGFYGGFVQAGVGFFLLFGLVFGAGLNLVTGNAAKVVLIASYTWIALLLFVFAGQVNFGLGLVLAAGNSSGAWVAARLAVKKGAPWVRWLLIVAALVAAIRMLTI